MSENDGLPEEADSLMELLKPLIWKAAMKARETGTEQEITFVFDPKEPLWD